MKHSLFWTLVFVLIVNSAIFAKQTDLEKIQAGVDRRLLNDCKTLENIITVPKVSRGAK